MFDTRPFERVTSLVLLPSVTVMPLIFAGGFAALAAMASDSAWAPIGVGCCALVSVPLASLALISILRWSRTGRARPFLQEVADALGGGDVSVGSLLFALISPRLTGTVNGLPYRLTLRRQAGLLSPSRVGGQFLVFGWMFDLRVDASIGCRVGFMPARHSTLGASLLNLREPIELPHLVAFTGGTERGRELVQRPAAQDAALKAVDFAGRGGCLLRVGPDAIDVSGTLRRDVTPAEVAAFLRAVADLARACA